MNAYDDITTYLPTEEDDETLAYYGMRQRDLELRYAMLNRKYQHKA